MEAAAPCSSAGAAWPGPGEPLGSLSSRSPECIEAEGRVTAPCCLPCSVDPNDQKKTACYDIDVEVEDPLKGQMSSFLLSTANQQEITALDNKVLACEGGGIMSRAHDCYMAHLQEDVEGGRAAMEVLCGRRGHRLCSGALT